MKELCNVESAVQVPCKLCGVSFNIGRVRRPNEPFRAGWSPVCGEPAALPEDRNKARQWENFISKDYVNWRRCRSTGCQDVKRLVASIDQDMKSTIENVSDGEDDDDYMYESKEDVEPLEYISEVVSEEELSMGDEGSSRSEPDDALTELVSTAVDDDGKSVEEGGSLFTNEMDLDSKRGTEDQQRRLSIGDSSKSPPLMAEADSASDSESSESTDWDTCQKLEHLAGPRCKHASGYCGFNISAEEMKGCTTLQCLVMKTPEWISEPDDQEFEQSGEYYLSGLSGQMPSRDIGGPRMTPPRHGAEDLHPDVNESGVPIPFHPTCFEIFTRASRLRTSSIDLVGLTGWEVWDTVLPSFWATTTVSTLSAEMRKKEEAERQRVASRKIIQQELPKIAEIWDIDHAKGDMSYAACGNEGMKETMVRPKDGTNWCRVYYEVKMNWKKLKGLHNRERIWRDIEEILRRIDKYRGEGSIA